jgi:hypothetical protein
MIDAAVDPLVIIRLNGDNGYCTTPVPKHNPTRMPRDT